VNNTANNDFLPPSSVFSASPIFEVIPPSNSPIERIKLDIRTQLTNRLRQNASTTMFPNNLLGAMSSSGALVPSRIQQPPIIVNTASSTPVSVFKPGSPMFVPYMPFPAQIMSEFPGMGGPMIQPGIWNIHPDTSKQDHLEEIASIIAASKPAPLSVSKVPQFTATKNGYQTRGRRDNKPTNSSNNGNSNGNNNGNNNRENNNRPSNENGQSNNRGSAGGSNGGSNGGSGGNNNNNNNNDRNGQDKQVMEIVDEEDEDKSEQSKKRKRTSQAKDPEPTSNNEVVNEVDSDNDEVPPAKKPRITNTPLTTPHAMESINTSESRAMYTTRENTSTIAVGSPVPMPVPKVGVIYRHVI
jgi:hypothetical protein